MLDYAAFPEQRQALIRQILQENGCAICADLAVQLKVSEHTIRRDLHELSKEGFCKKVYGGAVLQLQDSATFTRRKTHNHAQKSLLAARCVQLVKPGSCIFIDTGTTNLAMASAFPADLSLTVVTNAPDIAAALLTHPLIEVIMLGGQVQKNIGGCVSGTALDQLRNMHFDQAWIGGCAMSPESGLTGFDFADCEFKKAAIGQSSQTLVALTADKIPGIARFGVARCEEIDVLVVESDLGRELGNVFEAASITLITA
ncbi:DeoR/GlpR family DNA-binding transcription regulator [Atlantibacter hermannii]|uniref:DeoR/GlpR family DNA-binding transcription regulator n=1 Tax=Atlantibacter hermannii TaxID=565 RepID=UPI0028ADEB3F|nr:DeoR/GlpR family DNA-binding transcription regulator [Atlantibacter hermannii]